MGGLLYKITDENPNPTGGCLCSESTHPDGAGPFTVFYVTEMENVYSPHAVVCAGCVLGAASDIQKKLADDEPVEEL
jgi:hypothetical protein